MEDLTPESQEIESQKVIGNKTEANEGSASAEDSALQAPLSMKKG